MTKASVFVMRQYVIRYLGKLRSVVTRLVPEQDARQEAWECLARLRKTAWIGDVLSPSGEQWEAEQPQKLRIRSH